MKESSPQQGSWGLLQANVFWQERESRRRVEPDHSSAAAVQKEERGGALRSRGRLANHSAPSLCSSMTLQNLIHPGSFPPHFWQEDPHREFFVVPWHLLVIYLVFLLLLAEASVSQSSEGRKSRRAIHFPCRYLRVKIRFEEVIMGYWPH